MIINRVSVILFIIAILLVKCPSVYAIGDYNVDLYEYEKEVIFLENQGSQTIYMDGVVNYTGYSVLGDTISLSSSSEIGVPSISPTEVTFHTTGTEEFTVQLIISNTYDNGTTGFLYVSGISQQGGITIEKGVVVTISIIKYNDTDNGNNYFNNSENHDADDNQSGIGSILMISSIIIIAIIIVVIYKKILK